MAKRKKVKSVKRNFDLYADEIAMIKKYKNRRAILFALLDEIAIRARVEFTTVKGKKKIHPRKAIFDESYRANDGTNF